MNIFISHISEERELAECLKKWIDVLFLGDFDVFVSSDHTSIRLGKEWMEQINSALSECGIMLILCSPTAITRPWISFELGCGWIKTIPTIPICHSGMTPAALPLPLGLLQGLCIAEAQFLEHLLHHLAKELGKKKAPPVHEAMMQELLQIQSSLHHNASSSHCSSKKAHNETVLDEGDIKAHLESWFLSKSNEERDLVINFASVDEELGLPAGSTKAHLKTVVSNRGYKVSQEGNNSIRFSYSMQILSAGRRESKWDHF